MTTEDMTIHRENWGRFFDMVSRMTKGQWMQLEIMGNDIGDQIAREWTQLNGLSYDQPNDVVFIHFENLEHEIHAPKEVIALQNGATKAILVKDQEGQTHLMHLRVPILIEAHRPQ